MCFQNIDKIFYVGFEGEKVWEKYCIYYTLKNREKKTKVQNIWCQNYPLLSITFFHIFLQMTSEDFVVVVYYLGNNYLTA